MLLTPQLLWWWWNVEIHPVQLGLSVLAGIVLLVETGRRMRRREPLWREFLHASCPDAAKRLASA